MSTKPLRTPVRIKVRRRGQHDADYETQIKAKASRATRISPVCAYTVTMVAAYERELLASELLDAGRFVEAAAMRATGLRISAEALAGVARPVYACLRRQYEMVVYAQASENCSFSDTRL
jgi:hypothetical protein